jgi:hypothetical protein
MLVPLSTLHFSWGIRPPLWGRHGSRLVPPNTGPCNDLVAGFWLVLTFPLFRSSQPTKGITVFPVVSECPVPDRCLDNPHGDATSWFRSYERYIQIPV